MTVVCLALANTDWYLRQLRDAPIRPFDESRAPAIWRGLHPVRPSGPLHSMTDEQIAAAFDPATIVALGRPGFTVNFGPFSHTYPPNTFLEPNQIAAIRIVQQNLTRRPIVWAATTGRDFGGLGDYVLQRGVGFTQLSAHPDTSAPGIAPGAFGGPALDITATRRLLWETYRYSGLDRGPVGQLESTPASIAASLAAPFGQLAAEAEARGDTAEVVRNLTRSLALRPNPALQAALDAMHQGRFPVAPTPPLPSR